MKRFLFFSLLIACISGFAQEQQPLDSLARLVIVRKANHLGSGFVYRLMQNNSQFGIIRNESYFDGNVNSGNSSMVYTYGQKADSQVLISSLVAGTSYYFLMEILPIQSDSINTNKKSDFTFRLLPITKETADNIIIEDYLNRISTKDMCPFVALQFNFTHVDFRIGRGVVSNEYTIFEKTSGDNAKISPGGGMVYGFKFGYTFNRFFDIGGGANYQVSSLQEDLSNVKARFSRFVINANFQTMLMLTETNYVGIGAGVNTYLGPRLVVDGAKLINQKQIYYYKDAVGCQIFLEWRRFVNQCCISADLCYSKVSYQLDHMTVNGASEVYIPNKLEDISHINGGGINLELSIGYLF